MSISEDFLNDILTRVEAIEKEALQADKGDVETLMWPGQQTTTPYWVNRWGPYELDYDYGEDIPIDRFSVLMRLVGGHFKEGYEGESQTDLLKWMVAVMNAFEDATNLESATYPDGIEFIADPGATLVSNTGLVIFQNAGVLAQPAGIEFTLQIPVLRQAY